MRYYIFENFQMKENDRQHNNRNALIQEYPTTDTSMQETYFRIFATRNKARSKIHGHRISSPNNKEAQECAYYCSPRHEINEGYEHMYEGKNNRFYSNSKGNNNPMGRDEDYNLIGTYSKNDYDGKSDYRISKPSSNLSINNYGIEHYRNERQGQELKRNDCEQEDVLDLLNKAYVEIKLRDEIIQQKNQELQEKENNIQLLQSRISPPVSEDIEYLKKKLSESDSETHLLNTKIAYLQSQLGQMKQIINNMQHEYFQMETKTQTINQNISQILKQNQNMERYGPMSPFDVKSQRTGQQNRLTFNDTHSSRGKRSNSKGKWRNDGRKKDIRNEYYSRMKGEKGEQYTFRAINK